MRSVLLSFIYNGLQDTQIYTAGSLTRCYLNENKVLFTCKKKCILHPALPATFVSIDWTHFITRVYETYIYRRTSI